MPQGHTTEDMKILLIRPPASHTPGAPRPSAGLPVGLLSIAAMLEKNGFPVEVLDGQVDLERPVTPASGNRFHMGLSWDALAREIGVRKPDIIGITCPFTTQAENALQAADIARRAMPEAVIAVGGNHPSARPNEFFTKTAAVDIVCLGEGEYTLLDIALSVREGGSWADIPGTFVRNGEGVRVNLERPRIANLDDLPFPAYHLVDMEAYFRIQGMGWSDRPGPPVDGSERAVSVITSRGCPFNCVFCSIHLHMGRKWRAHSVEYVLSHIEHLISKYGITHVHFEDDNISANVKRFKGMLDGFLGIGAPFTWDTPNGVRVDTLSKEILADCKKSGCVYLVFGVESGNQKVLNGIVDKKLDLDDVIRAAAWCRETALDAMSFFVIGFPGETTKEMLDTVDFALRLQREYDVSPGLFVATPLPGTRLEQDFVERGLIEGSLPPETLSRITHGDLTIDGGTFTKEEVRRIRESFLKGYKANVARNFLHFLIRHPGTLPALAKAFFRGRRRKPAIEALLDVHLFKNFIVGSAVRGNT